MGIFFLFLLPYFRFEHGPWCLSLSILLMSVAPCHDRTYIGIQLWSVLLLLVCVGSAFSARIPCSTQIANVTGEGGGGGDKIVQ